MVTLHTNFGAIKLKMFEDKAPISAKNFKQYVRDGFYDGTIFHRVIGNFMIQGGGFDENMQQKHTNSPIKNEADNGLSNIKGTIAMARTSDPHSATAQFFINVTDNTFLDFTAPNAQGFGYAVFGEVIDGMDVVEKIKAVKTGNKNGHGDVPLENVVITKAELN